MGCPHIPEITYGDFSKSFHRKFAQQRVPIGGSIEITQRCNLRCAHCYVNLPAHDQEIRQRELSLAQWRRLLDELADEGCLWLLLTGGEPLLRPDFLEIYTYAKQTGFLISLFTNGTLITPHLADYLAEWPPFVVEVTIYGSSKGTYEAVTGVPGSYERCRRGIQLLLDRKIPLKLKTMVMTLNQHELQEMQSWAAALGVEFRFDAMLNARLSDDSQRPCALRISPEQVVALDLADERRSEEWRKFIEKFHGPFQADTLYVCGAGLQSFHIDPQGALSLCALAREQSYCLITGSFHRGWREFLGEVRNQQRQHDIPCARCEWMALCGYCPGMSWLEHGDSEKPIEYFCRVAQLRAAAFANNH